MERPADNSVRLPPDGVRLRREPQLATEPMWSWRDNGWPTQTIGGFHILRLGKTLD
jgi:hypothetical protein